MVLNAPVGHDVAVIVRLRAQRRGSEKSIMFTVRNQYAKTRQIGAGAPILQFVLFSGIFTL
jgi:hypothetical protein